MKEVKFPVVTFDKEEHVSYAKDEDDLSVCTKTSLDNGYYDYLLIIDIEGKQYIVEGVSRKQVLGYNIFLQKRFKVGLNINSNFPKITLEDFKNKLSNSYKKHTKFWSSSSDFQDTLDLIMSGESIEKIIGELCERFWKEY